MSGTLKPMWAPSQERIQSTILAHFVAETAGLSGNALPDYDKVWDWSVANPEQFWDALWDFCGVVGDKSGPVMADTDRLMDAQFFPEAKVNFAENLLAHAGSGPCIYFSG